jgi:hypothetical protein
MKTNKKTYSNFKPKKQKKSKKGVSVIVGYVLLITFSVFLGVIVYKLIKSWVPVETLRCPDGTSLLIESYNYDCDLEFITLNIANDGKFNVGGYFIRATDSPDLTMGNVELSTLNMDINSRLNPGVKFGSYTAKNSLKPNMVEEDSYDLSSLDNRIYLIEIIPIIWKTQERKMRLVSCEEVVLRKPVECS